MKEIIQTILGLIGAFSALYFGAYIIELARHKVRRNMRVCDNCYDIIKKLKS